jgi:hypothetical protein
MTQKEKLQLVFRIKQWCKAAYAEDEDAVESFDDPYRGIFDIHLDGRKLAEFFEKHPELRSKVRGKFGSWERLNLDPPVYFVFKKTFGTFKPVD